MARRREALALPEDTFGLRMVLAGGPGGPDDLGYSDEQLELGWQRYREELIDRGAHRPGDRTWAYWHFELEIEEPATRLERVLALEERGLLTDQERERIKVDAAHARERVPGPVGSVVTSPPEAKVNMARRRREWEDEAIAIAEALGIEA